MSPYEEKIARLCYEHYQSTGSRKYTYIAHSGDDMVHATNSLSSMEQDGYINDLVDEGFKYSFVIEDSLIRYYQR